MSEGKSSPPIRVVQYIQKNPKKITVFLILIALIVVIVVDSITRGCVYQESLPETEVRLICSIPSDSPDYNNTLIIAKSPLNSTETCVFEEFTSNSNLDYNAESQRCERPVACLERALSDFTKWIKDNIVLGAFLSALLYALATVLFAPGSILTLGVGAAFVGSLGVELGMLVGVLAVWIGASVGAVVAFFLGRYLFRESVMGWIEDYKWLKAIDSAFRTEGLKLLGLLRLSPLVPFNLFNYLMGTTDISAFDYTIGTVFGILPGTTAYVFLGGVIASTSQSVLSGGGCENAGADSLQTILLIIGVVLAILAVALLGYYARGHLKRIIEEEEAKNKSSDENNNNNATVAPIP